MVSDPDKERWIPIGNTVLEYEITFLTLHYIGNIAYAFEYMRNIQ